MYIDLVGKTFGRLTVIERAHTENKQIYWHCKCECGKELDVKGVLLRYNKTRSCGCLRREMVIKKNTTHGLGHSKINMVWQEMKSRCKNPNHKRYKDYGGRGITYQESWEHFENFYYDMFPTYQEGLTLDRVDNEGNYSKENCRWVTQLAQNNNKRNSVYETVGDIRATRSELADMFHIPRCTFYWRLKRGYSVEEALGIKKHEEG